MVGKAGIVHPSAYHCLVNKSLVLYTRAHGAIQTLKHINIGRPN